MAAALEGIDWSAVRMHLVACNGDYAATSQAFGGLRQDAIRQRASRGEWLSHLQKERVTKMELVSQVSQKVVETWESRQNAHRELVHRTTRKMLEKAEKAPPAIENTADYEKAVKVARLTLGLKDEATSAVQVNVWGGQAGAGFGASVEAAEVIDCTDSDDNWI